MSMLPMYKMCPVCKRRYSWNPDVGQMFCPRCKVPPVVKRVEGILKYLKKKK